MLRKITNKIVGRKKLVDKVLTFVEAIDLLEDLDDSVKSHIGYTCGAKGYVEHNLSPSEVVEFINKNFIPFNKKCSDIKYEVFKGNLREKHYLDLVRDRRDLDIKHMQYATKAEISYLVDINFLSPLVNPLIVSPSFT